MWDIEYYESATGKRPVEEFIDSLDAKSRARIARTLDMLEEFGVLLHRFAKKTGPVPRTDIETA